MGLLRGLWRLAVQMLLLMAGATAIYAIAALVLGLFSVNRDFIEAADGIEIFLVSNGVHAAFAVPMDSPVADLRKDLPLPEAVREVKDAYVFIGWGDARIYPSTQTWTQLTASNAITTLLGLNGTVMHVEHARKPAASDRFVPIRISADGYRRLLVHISSSLRRDESGRLMRVAGASHGRMDAFYEALGRYTLIYTCNEWVREGLAKAGVRTARWAPLEPALFWQLRGSR